MNTFSNFGTETGRQAEKIYTTFHIIKPTLSLLQFIHFNNRSPI